MYIHTMYIYIYIYIYIHTRVSLIGWSEATGLGPKTERLRRQRRPNKIAGRHLCGDLTTIPPSITSRATIEFQQNLKFTPLAIYF